MACCARSLSVTTAGAVCRSAVSAVSASPSTMSASPSSATAATLGPPFIAALASRAARRGSCLAQASRAATSSMSGSVVEPLSSRHTAARSTSSRRRSPLASSASASIRSRRRVRSVPQPPRTTSP
jgi:hypothetical protein